MQVVPQNAHDVLVVLAVDAEALQANVVGRVELAERLPDRRVVQEHLALVRGRLDVERPLSAQRIPNRPVPVLLGRVPDRLLEQILAQVLLVPIRVRLAKHGPAGALDKERSDARVAQHRVDHVGEEGRILRPREQAKRVARRGVCI